MSILYNYIILYVFIILYVYTIKPYNTNVYITHQMYTIIT
jgi:hypothetical protein